MARLRRRSARRVPLRNVVAALLIGIHATAAAQTLAEVSALLERIADAQQVASAVLPAHHEICKQDIAAHVRRRPCAPPHKRHIPALSGVDTLRRSWCAAPARVMKLVSVPGCPRRCRCSLSRRHPLCLPAARARRVPLLAPCTEHAGRQAGWQAGRHLLSWCCATQSLSTSFCCTPSTLPWMLPLPWLFLHG